MADIVSMPKLGFDMAEGTLVHWVKKVGESVAKGDVLAEIETDKATVEVESSFEGVMARQLVEEKEIVPVGTPIAVIAAPGEEVAEVPAPQAEKPGAPKEESAPAAALAPEAAPAVAEAQAGSGMVKASPLAKRMAKDHQLNLAELEGSGPGGRVVKKDVEQALASPKSAAPLAAAVETKAALPPAAWSAAGAPADERVSLNKLRQAIGRRMVESKQTVPHFYLTYDVDAAPLLELRKQVNELLPEEEKTSVNDFLIKAAAVALRRFPNLNASLQGTEVVRHGHVNIGVAVAVEGGLLTVVTRDADQKPVRVISGEVKSLVKRARDGKVRPEDIEGSTFSISNLGMYQVEEFGAIINPPEAAILAVGAARETPVVVNGEVKAGLRMKLTLSVDHRVSDGAEGAQFMQWLKQIIEQPLHLMI